MNSHRFAWLTCVCVSAALVGLPLVGGTAFGLPIGPGFDYFLTPPGGASVDLGMGPIPLTGVPLPNMALGLTDTVVARMDPGPPLGGTGIIDIELVALHLRSLAPVPTPGGPADVHITIDNSDNFWTGVHPRPRGNGSGPSFFDLPTVPSPPSIGQMEMTHTPGGATMRACFGDDPSCDGTGPLLGAGLGIGPPPPTGGIYASIFFVTPGGDPSNPTDVMAAMPAPPVTLASSGTYVHTTLRPREFGGIIMPGPPIHVGPHPETQPVPDDAVPEPAGALLALCAIMGCGLLRRRNG
jgi:hypothetical protein